MRNQEKLTSIVSVSLAIMVVVIVMLLTSCSKEKESIGGQSEELIEKVSGPGPIYFPIITVKFSWEWHRKNYNCKSGWGICNFNVSQKVDAKENDLNQTDIYQTSDGNYIVFLEAPKDAPFEDEDKSFYVDEDITEIDPDGNCLTILAGKYIFDESIGLNGGYAIPIIKG